MAPALLVVDNEAPIQDLLAQLFVGAGYEVASASDGEEAIAVLERRSASLGAVIIDLGLGAGPDGWQVARRARELDPTLPLVYITGTRGDSAPAGAPDGVMLLKPFTADQALAVVSALARPDG